MHCLADIAGTHNVYFDENSGKSEKQMGSSVFFYFQIVKASYMPTRGSIVNIRIFTCDYSETFNNSLQMNIRPE